MFEDPYQRARAYVEALLPTLHHKGCACRRCQIFRPRVEMTMALIEKVDQVAAAGEILAREYAAERPPDAVQDFAFVTPSAMSPGMFRWTWFDARGWGGHYDQFVSAKDAFYDMVESGYRFPAYGVLETYMAGRLWEPSPNAFASRGTGKG